MIRGIKRTSWKHHHLKNVLHEYINSLCEHELDKTYYTIDIIYKTVMEVSYKLWMYLKIYFNFKSLRNEVWLTFGCLKEVPGVGHPGPAFYL